MELTTENTMKVIGENSVTITNIAVIYGGYGPTMPEVPQNRPPGMFWVKWEPGKTWTSEVPGNPAHVSRKLAEKAGWPDADHVFEKEIESHGIDVNAPRTADGFHWFWVCAGSEYLTPPPPKEA